MLIVYYIIVIAMVAAQFIDGYGNDFWLNFWVVMLIIPILVRYACHV